MVFVGTPQVNALRIYNLSAPKFKSKLINFLTASSWRATGCRHPLILEPSGPAASHQQTLTPQPALWSCINSAKEIKHTCKEARERKRRWLKQMVSFGVNAPGAYRVKEKKNTVRRGGKKTAPQEEGNKVITVTAHMAITPTDYFIEALKHLRYSVFPGNIQMKVSR